MAALEAFLSDHSAPILPPLLRSPKMPCLSVCTMLNPAVQEKTEVEKGNRSARLATKNTASLSTMEKVKVLLLKKSGDAPIDESGQVDLKAYAQLYSKPVSANSSTP